MARWLGAAPRRRPPDPHRRPRRGPELGPHRPHARVRRCSPASARTTAAAATTAPSPTSAPASSAGSQATTHRPSPANALSAHKPHRVHTAPPAHKPATLGVWRIKLAGEARFSAHTPRWGSRGSRRGRRRGREPPAALSHGDERLDRRRVAEASPRHAGVYAVGHRALTQRRDGWPRSSPAARCVLSHLDAAVLWGFYDRLGPRIHVTVKWQRSINGLILHRTRRLDTGRGDHEERHPGHHRGADVGRPHRPPQRGPATTGTERGGVPTPPRPRLPQAAVERAHGRRNLKPLKQAIAQHRPAR